MRTPAKLLLLLIVAGAFTAYRASQPPPAPDEAALARQAKAIADDPATKVTVLNMTWNSGSFGSIGSVTITIENANDYAVKDIGVLCEFSGKSGTKLTTSKQTIYDTLKPKARRIFKDVNMGFINSQSSQAGCGIESARRM